MKKIVLIIFILLSVKSAFSQCATPTGSTNTACGTGTRITANQSGFSLTGGSTYYIAAGDNYTLSGTTTLTSGRIIVCGTLNITGTLNFSHSSTVEVLTKLGGTLNVGTSGASIGSFSINSNEGFTNYGTSTFYVNTFTLDNTSYINNADKYGKFYIYGNLTLASASGSGIVNRGRFYVYQNGGAGGVTLNNTLPNTICLEKSYFETNSLNLGWINGGLFNNQSGSNGADIKVVGAISTGDASIHLFYNNGTTASSNVSLCYGSNPNNGNTSTATLNDGCSSTVPVIFGNIKATKQNNSTNIKWTTLQEFNNDYFILEKSRDGVIFESISKVKGVGNSNIPLSYNTEDFGNTDGITYYRIKQVDKNGDFEYSSIFSLSDELKKGFIVYPNPVDNSLTQLFLENHSNDHIYVTVYSDLGQIISTGDIIVGEGEVVDVFAGLHNLSSGIYEVKITTNSEVHIEKIIIH